MPTLKKNKTIRFSATISVVFLAFLLTIFSPRKAEAAWIPGIDPPIQRALDTAYDQLMGIIRGAAKQAAVKMLNGQLDVQMGGQNGNVAFVANWRSWLQDDPEKNASLIVNDNLSKMLGGRGNSLSYSSEGFSGTGNYANSLSQMEKDAINQENSLPKMTYEGDPSQMFASGNFDNMSLYFSGVNNPWAFDLAVQDQYQKELKLQISMNQTKVTAYSGFKGTVGSNGSITYPGSLTKELAANIQNLPNNVVAAATSIPEVISSVVSQMLTKMTQQGFSSVQKDSQNSQSTQNKLGSGIDGLISSNGPGAPFVDPLTSNLMNSSGGGLSGLPGGLSGISGGGLGGFSSGGLGF